MVYAPFSSEMDRIITLGNLRKNPTELPEKFKKRAGSLYDEMKQLIISLLQENYKKRPSSKELFQKYQDSLYQEMIIKDVREYKKIINFLFSKKNMFDFDNLEVDFEDFEKASQVSMGTNGISSRYVNMASLDHGVFKNESTIYGFIQQKMRACFTIHEAMKVDVDPIIASNDTR